MTCWVTKLPNDKSQLIDGKIVTRWVTELPNGKLQLVGGETVFPTTNIELASGNLVT